MTFDPSQYGNISDADLDSMAAAQSQPVASSFNPADYNHISDADLDKMAQDQSSTTSDVLKSVAGNVAPTAAANWAANAISPAATLSSYALQGGMTVGKYAGEGIDELTRLATGQPQATQAEYDENSRQLMNAARAKLGLSPTDNGDLSSIVPTPSNLVSGAAKAFGMPLYQPKTQVGKDVTSIGDIAAGAAGSGAPLIGTAAGALAGTFLPQGVKAAGGTQAEQELAGIAGGLGAGIGAEGLSRSPTVTGGLQETAYNDLPPNEQLTAKSPPLDPVDIIRSHGASQATASNVNGIIGDNLRTMAGNATGYAPNARDAVETMLDQAQNGTEPINNRGQVIKALTHTLGQFDENGNMPVRAALDLKVLANQNYNTGQNLYKGAWGDVRSAADDVLSDHAIDNPEFGDMLHLQRVHNANDVGEAYNNNDTLQKMFGRDDLKNVSDADNGILRSVGTDTQKAANSIVSKVKTPEDYQAVARGIDDPQVRQQFNDAVLRNILPSRGQYLWNTLKNAGNFHFADALEDFGKTFIPKLGLTDAQLGIYNAIKNENVNPTRYSVGQTEAKANSIMSGWQARQGQQAATNAAMGPDIAYHQFEHGVSQARQAATDAQAAHDAGVRGAQKQFRSDAYNSGMRALPSPSINVPAEGFGQQPTASLDIGAQLQPQRALPRPQQYTNEQIADRWGLPSPSSVPINLPQGAVGRTYNPNDLNVSGDISVPETKMDSNPQKPSYLNVSEPPKPVSAGKALPVGKQEKPYSFFDVLKKAGGIQRTAKGGENLTNVMDVGSAPRGLIKQNGLTHEQALQLGIREGFIPDNGANPNTPSANQLQDLYDLMDKGKEPHPKFAGQSSDKAYRNNLEMEADKRGIDHTGMTADQITAELNSHKTLEEKEMEAFYANEAAKTGGSPAETAKSVSGNERFASRATGTKGVSPNVGSSSQGNDAPQLPLDKDEIPFAKGGKVTPSISEWSRLLHKSRKKGLNLTAKDRLDPEKVNAVRRVVN